MMMIYTSLSPMRNTHTCMPASTRQIVFETSGNNKSQLLLTTNTPSNLTCNGRHQHPTVVSNNQGANMQAKDNPKAKACPSSHEC